MHPRFTLEPLVFGLNIYSSVTYIVFGVDTLPPVNEHIRRLSKVYLYRVITCVTKISYQDSAEDRYMHTLQNLTRLYYLSASTRTSL